MRCPECGTSFRVPDGEEGDHDCPSCGYGEDTRPDACPHCGASCTAHTGAYCHECGTVLQDKS